MRENRTSKLHTQQKSRGGQLPVGPPGPRVLLTCGSVCKHCISFHEELEEFKCFGKNHHETPSRSAVKWWFSSLKEVPCVPGSVALSLSCP